MFVPSRDLIRERIREEAPFSVQQNGLDRLCLPFRLPDGNPWLLYADSSAHSSRMLHCAQEDLSRVGLLCASELKNVLRLLEARNMRAEVRQIHAVTKMAQEERLELWGKSLSFRMCLERAKVVSATDAAVLLLGETGVGKEVMANYVHRHSGCKGPFVAVHPASVSEHLFENEFFGHEKGAFTGATGQKIGFFELADNGTLFIDEVGDIPMNMQIKLLRVLQEHRFMRVGGTKEIHSSFRLIAATNRDLPRAVREGTFREDLYYRISVIPVTIPPLRERLEDLEELIMAFTDHFSRRYGKKLPYPDEETLRRLSEYQWPGNIRELRNAVERAVILYTGGPFDLAVGGQHEARDHCQRAETSLYADTPTLLELQKRYIQYILNKTGGRISGENGAEKLLGMKRSTLYLKLRQYGIKPGERERERERESLTYLTNTSNVDSFSLIFYIYRKIPEPGPDRFYRLFPLVDYPFCYPFSASRLLFPQEYNVVIENKIFSEKISFFSVSLLFVLRTELPSAMFPPAWSAGVFCIYGSVLFPSAPDDLPCIRAPPLNAPYPPGRRRKPPRRCLCGYA